MSERRNRHARTSLGARWVAAQRLRLEGTRPSTPGGDIDAERRLYRDVAGAGAGAANVPAAQSSGLALRTQVIDAEVARAVGRGATQVVLLGAGEDGRALRFGGGAVRWFEVDDAQRQAEKRRRLGALGIATTNATYIGLDLLHDDLGLALDASGFDVHASALFVAEGLFDALTLEATASVCAALRARAVPPSVLVATFSVTPEGGDVTRALRSATGLLRQAANEPRRNEFRPGDPQKLMVVTGWRVTHHESSAERRLDPGAHMLVLVCEPDPARGG